MPPTMRELAADLGLNVATVSRALDPARAHLVAAQGGIALRALPRHRRIRSQRRPGSRRTPVSEERGLDCPGDVGVSGYYDTFLGSHITRALSTVRWPVEEVGPCLTELALSAVAGQPASVPELVSVAPELVARRPTHGGLPGQ